MTPKLYTISDPDLEHAEWTASIPVGDGSEVLDVKLIPYEVDEDYAAFHNDGTWINGKNWQDLAKLAMELAEDFRQMAKNQMDTNKTLLDMLKLSNEEMKDEHGES